MEERDLVWSVDEKHVYCYRRRIRANRETFRVLSDSFATDGEKIFSQSGWLKAADAPTFQIIAAYEATDNGGHCCYAGDKNFVYYQSRRSSKPKVIKSTACADFTWLEGPYGRSTRSVFWEGCKIEKADPKSFCVINDTFSKDCKRAYFRTRPISGSDPVTFTPVEYENSDFLSVFSKDNRAVYYQEHLIPNADSSSFKAACVGYGCYGEDKNRRWTDKELRELCIKKEEVMYPRVEIDTTISNIAFHESLFVGYEKQLLGLFLLVNYASVEKFREVSHGKMSVKALFQGIESLQKLLKTPIAIFGEDTITITSAGYTLYTQYGDVMREIFRAFDPLSNDAR